MGLCQNKEGFIYGCEKPGNISQNFRGSGTVAMLYFWILTHVRSSFCLLCKGSSINNKEPSQATHFRLPTSIPVGSSLHLEGSICKSMISNTTSDGLSRGLGKR